MLYSKLDNVMVEVEGTFVDAKEYILEITHQNKALFSKKTELEQEVRRLSEENDRMARRLVLLDKPVKAVAMPQSGEVINWYEKWLAEHQEHEGLKDECDDLRKLLHAKDETMASQMDDYENLQTLYQNVEALYNQGCKARDQATYTLSAVKGFVRVLIDSAVAEDRSIITHQSILDYLGRAMSQLAGGNLTLDEPGGVAVAQIPRNSPFARRKTDEK